MLGHPVAEEGEHPHDQSQPPVQDAPLCHVPLELVNADTAFVLVLNAEQVEKEHPLKVPYTEALLLALSISFVAADAKLVTSENGK